MWRTLDNEAWNLNMSCTHTQQMLENWRWSWLWATQWSKSLNRSFISFILMLLDILEKPCKSEGRIFAVKQSPLGGEADETFRSAGTCWHHPNARNAKESPVDWVFECPWYCYSWNKSMKPKWAKCKDMQMFFCGYVWVSMTAMTSYHKSSRRNFPISVICRERLEAELRICKERFALVRN